MRKSFKKNMIKLVLFGGEFPRIVVSFLFFIPIVIGGSLFTFSSCTEEPKVEEPVHWTKEQSTQMHHDLAAEEELDINLFLAQHAGWKMTKTGSGLQYYIYEKGDGALGKVGDLAQVEFTITLLDGTECYKTEDNEIQEFKIDLSEVETGIQEGVKLLHKGDRVKMIIPSHLAHGLVGDMNKIPPLTPIVVDLYLRDLL